MISHHVMKACIFPYPPIFMDEKLSHKRLKNKP